MAVKQLALLALALHGAAALSVRVAGPNQQNLFGMPADTAMDNKASWGGGQGNLAYVPAWLDKPTAWYFEVPGLWEDEYLEMKADAAPASGAKCTSTMYVAVYACGDDTCEKKVRGDFAAQLAADGWTRYTYAPRYTLLSSGTLQHTTHLYAKTINAGETVATPAMGKGYKASHGVAVFATGCESDASPLAPSPATGAGGSGTGAGGPVPTPVPVADSDAAAGTPPRNVGPSQTLCASQCPADAAATDNGGAGGNSNSGTPPTDSGYGGYSYGSGNYYYGGYSTYGYGR